MKKLMKLKYVVTTLLTVLVIGSGCTANIRSKAWGGSMTVVLPQGVKLVNVTWKGGGNLWYLTRSMKSNEVADSYVFQEKSSYGMMEGKVIFQEVK